MTDIKHTPLPWHFHAIAIGSSGRPTAHIYTLHVKNGEAQHYTSNPPFKHLFIGEFVHQIWKGNVLADEKANAEFIVKACNSYYESQATIASQEETIRELVEVLKKTGVRNDSKTLGIVNKAIKKVESKFNEASS